MKSASAPPLPIGDWSYPNTLCVQYTNDQEYRALMRRITQSQSHHMVVAGSEEVDDITRDEWDFDEAAVSQFLHTIYRHTRHIPAFQDVFTKAAGHLLSTDPEMGLAILFSYDYFSLFHACLCLFFTSPTADLSGSEPFVRLTQRL